MFTAKYNQTGRLSIITLFTHDLGYGTGYGEIPLLGYGEISLSRKKSAGVYVFDLNIEARLSKSM